MAGTGAKWLWGCGIGCAVLLLLAVVGVVVGGLFLRDTFKGFDAAQESRRAVDTRFGEIASYTPPASGAVAPERMEAFLAVREATAPARERIARAFSGIPMSEAAARELDEKRPMEKLRSVFGIVGSALDVGRSLGEFYDSRSRALLAAEMGLGEYTYLYVLTYGVWLGHRLDEIPLPTPARAEAEEPGSQEKRESWSLDTLERVREDLRKMLQNQLASSGAAPEAGEEQQALTAEIAKLEHDPARWPWQDGLPAAIVAAFEPHRARLEASYDPATNAFELMHGEKNGEFHFELK